MTLDELKGRIEALSGQDRPDPVEGRLVVNELLAALETGRVRAAEPRSEEWVVHPWVKSGILLGFRVSEEVADESSAPFYFRDKALFPTWNPERAGRRVRIVPGGSTVRRGSHVADGVVVMPPAYVNVGAYVGAGSMVDSHALVGSCAQIGARVHLSAAVQIGGVLEPVGARPTIIEDDAFVGGGAGVYEGTRVGRGAVLAPGVCLTRGVRVYDVVEERVIAAGEHGALTIPPRAVVVPGVRRLAGEFAGRHGLGLASPVIVKYRDPSTDAALVLEESLH